MTYKRILTVQDISCLGQCSLTVALPILSACGIETCVIPSAVLSTHTGGFTGYTFKDLTDEMPAIMKHWEAEKISFDAIYSGYLGSALQIDYVKTLADKFLRKGGVSIVDPAMADNGKLYVGFDMEYVRAMGGLCSSADIVLPNLTEACLLTGEEWTPVCSRELVDKLIGRLRDMGVKTIVLTGVSFREGKTGVFVDEAAGGGGEYYEHKLIAEGCHGTGDVYASAFAGGLLRGMRAFDAARIAADYTVACIESTKDDASHWYGVKFEQRIPMLLKMLGEV